MRTPRPAGGCHQCCTSPSGNWRSAQRSRCSRTSRGSACTRAIAVLQLIAEAEGAAGLVVAAACPEAAGQRLVEEPAIGQHVQGRIRRLDLHGAEGALPVLPHALERGARCAGLPQSLREFARAFDILPGAEAEDDLVLLPVRQVKGHLDRAARIERRPEPARKPRAGHRCRTRELSIAPEELSAVAGERAGRDRRRRRTRRVRRIRVL